VDPGVFVITQIKECRNRMGYCILGISCSVDSDFVEDDLGGHCDRLSEAFNPKASFVCCKQNPANFEDGENDLEAVILETNVGHETATTASAVTEKKEKSTTLVPQYSTSIVTEMITELQTQTETVTKVEEVTKVVTQIITELVNETGVGYQDQHHIPEDWNEPVQNDEEVNEEAFLESPEVANEIQDGISGNINRMDENVLNSSGEVLDFSESYDTADFIPSLGAPSSFSSVLNSMPEILSDPWIEVINSNTESKKTENIPTWGELQTFGSDPVDEESYGDWDETEDGNWDPENQNNNPANFLSPIAVNNEGAGQGLVYEFEIGQTLPGTEEVTKDGQASILRPGLVIDDPTLLESIVSTSFVNVNEEKDNVAPVGTIVEVDLDDEYPIYETGPIVEIENEYPNLPSGPIVEIESVPIFQDFLQTDNTALDVNTVGDTAGIYYEPIGISDAINNEDYIDEEIDYPYYEHYEQETTVPPSEPELHCDLSILLSGISCSFKSLDKDEAVKTPPPLKYRPTIDRDNQVIDNEDAFLSRPGLFEITPPVEGLDWQDSVTTKFDNLVMEQDTENPFFELPSALPAMEPPTVSQDFRDKAELSESDNAILEFDESGIQIKIPANILQSELGEIATNIPDTDYEFSAKLKKNYREAQNTGGHFLEDEGFSGDATVLDNNPEIQKYHNLNNLHQDAELLQLFIEQIERTSNITLVNATIINRPFSDEDIVTIRNTKETVEPELDEKETEKETSFTPINSQIISTAVTIIDTNNNKDISAVSWSEAGSDDSDGQEDFDDTKGDVISVAATVTRPKKNICGVKGGKSVEQAYGKEASKYILPLLIDSWVFGKDQEQKARFEDTEARVIGGKVTSTVLYCWVAAILTLEGEFVCTGTLVADDLVLTSGSCINFLFKRGLTNFKVVLGDSNLKIDLQFGVQEHKILQALVHEDYDINDEYHENDIGFVILQSRAKLEENVCLLCLPKPHLDIEESSCTVTGYGKPSLNTPIPRGAAYWEDKTTDGILREAELDILNTDVCSEYVAGKSEEIEQKEMNMTNVVCAGGNGNEKACFVAMDGGSPLACESNGNYYLGGMVMFGTACGQDSVPSMFVRVSEYVEWILSSYATLSDRNSS